MASFPNFVKKVNLPKLKYQANFIIAYDIHITAYGLGTYKAISIGVTLNETSI